MSPMPPSSALQKRRGKAVKSTARMAMHVSTIMTPRYSVTASVLGSRLGRVQAMAAHKPAETKAIGGKVAGSISARTSTLHCRAASC